MSISEGEYQQVISEVPVVLERAGVINKTRATFIRMVTREVIDSPNPRFSSMRRTAKTWNTRAWGLAYSLVLSYLDDHRVSETIAVITDELGSLATPVAEIGMMSLQTLVAERTCSPSSDMDLRFDNSAETELSEEEDVADIFRFED